MHLIPLQEWCSGDALHFDISFWCVIEEACLFTPWHSMLPRILRKPAIVI